VYVKREERCTFQNTFSFSDLSFPFVFYVHLLKKPIYYCKANYRDYNIILRVKKIIFPSLNTHCIAKHLEKTVDLNEL
jgi:hypothetical protein